MSLQNMPALLTIMKPISFALLLISLFSVNSASATDGYFSIGYGIKSQGMGGVGIALPQDALAAASNPAGMGLIGNRVDFGVTWFKPSREAELENSAVGTQTYDGNDSEHFFIPEFGYNRQINPDLTFGISVYANGGMNTDYKKGIPLFGSNGRAGVDLAQAFAAPTVTWKVNERHIIGASINLAYQRFEMKGLQGFAGFSTSPNNLTNNGHDNAYGAGIHLGWVGQLNKSVRVGATYQSKTYMTEFDKYKGLFAEQGDFDIPETYGVGIALSVTPKLTLAGDIQRINYSDIAAVGNASLANLGNGLGANNGAGFGWRDTTSYKLGVSYQYNPNLTLRAGYNHSTQPITSDNTLFNILAPGVVKDHLTLGMTWVMDNKGELSIAYVHAFEEEVNGQNSIPAMPLGGGEANISMHQDSLGIAYGWPF